MTDSHPVPSIVGRSNSGKATLMVKLLPWLIARGWRVGAPKHHVRGFTMDIEGKETCRPEPLPGRPDAGSLGDGPFRPAGGAGPRRGRGGGAGVLERTPVPEGAREGERP
ncbi:MAG: molybdopterin-guanine dinucleotide biosynthesis protein MobB [Acidobacteriota bacterium]